MKNNNR